MTIGVFCGGAVIGWSSPALPELQSPNSTVPLTPEQGSWVGSLLAVGSFIGALPAGSVADLLGRKVMKIFSVKNYYSFDYSAFPFLLQIINHCYL